MIVTNILETEDPADMIILLTQTVANIEESVQIAMEFTALLQ